jgi:hypothetical protein
MCTIGWQIYLSVIPKADVELWKLVLIMVAGKITLRIRQLNFLKRADLIAVEGVSGFDVGSVNMTGELVAYN